MTKSLIHQADFRPENSESIKKKENEGQDIEGRPKNQSFRNTEKELAPSVEPREAVICDLI